MSFVDKISDKADQLPNVREMDIPTFCVTRTLQEHAICYTAYAKYMLVANSAGLQTKAEAYQTNITKHNGYYGFDYASLYEHHTMRVGDAMDAVTNYWPLFVNPSGTHIVGCIDDCVWATMLVHRLDKNYAPSSLTEEFKKLLGILGAEGIADESYENMAYMLGISGSVKTTMMRTAKIEKPISEWKTGRALGTQLKRFQREVMTYCRANIKKHNFQTERKLAEFIAHADKEAPDLNKQFWDRGDSRPWPICFEDIGGQYLQSVVDINAVLDSKEMQLIVEYSAASNKTLFNELLKNRKTQSQWYWLAKLAFVTDPFKDRGYVREAGNKLMRMRIERVQDPLKAPAFLNALFAEFNAFGNAPEEFATALIKMAYDLQQDVKFGVADSSVSKELQEQFSIPPTPMHIVLASRAAQLKLQRQLGEKPPESTDSGSMLPILLVGVLVFLMTS